MTVFMHDLHINFISRGQTFVVFLVSLSHLLTNMSQLYFSSYIQDNFPYFSAYGYVGRGMGENASPKNNFTCVEISPTLTIST